MDTDYILTQIKELACKVQERESGVLTEDSTSDLAYIVMYVNILNKESLFNV